MATHATHKSWLMVSGVLIAGFGPVLTLATLPGWAEPARWSLDLLAWPLDGFPSYGADEMRFLSALTGGFLVGWGVMVFCLALWVHDHAPEPVRRSLLTGVLAWFCVDSLGSITSGVWPNALWNVLVLVLIVGPLWRPADDEMTPTGDLA